MDAGEGDSDAIPFSRPHPRSKPQTVAENLHGNWNIERGHVTSTSCISSLVCMLQFPTTRRRTLVDIDTKASARNSES